MGQVEQRRVLVALARCDRALLDHRAWGGSLPGTTWRSLMTPATISLGVSWPSLQSPDYNPDVLFSVLFSLSPTCRPGRGTCAAAPRRPAGKGGSNRPPVAPQIPEQPTKPEHGQGPENQVQGGLPAGVHGGRSQLRHKRAAYGSSRGCWVSSPPRTFVDGWVLRPGASRR